MTVAYVFQTARKTSSLLLYTNTSTHEGEINIFGSAEFPTATCFRNVSYQVDNK